MVCVASFLVKEASFFSTNRLIPGDEHITAGWGRDYSDVSPTNGFIVGGGAHEVSVSVDVSPVNG